MNVDRVSVHYERKLNLGDYNSAAIGCTLWAAIEEGDDLSTCTKALWEMARENVRVQAMPLLAKDKDTREKASAYVREYMAGLPVVNGTTPTNETN
jgi:hypothetical protein